MVVRFPLRRASVLSVSALVIALPMAFCGCSEVPSGEAVQLSAANEPALTVAEAWAKATTHDSVSDEGKTGVFGVIRNHGEEDLTVAAVSSPAAGLVEFHEVVDGKMRAVTGDIVIPAGGSLELVPGGEHLMLLEMPAPVLPGDDVSVRLEFTDGSGYELTAMVRDTTGTVDGAEQSHDEHSAERDAEGTAG